MALKYIPPLTLTIQRVKNYHNRELAELIKATAIAVRPHDGIVSHVLLTEFAPFLARHAGAEKHSAVLSGMMDKATRKRTEQIIVATNTNETGTLAPLVKNIDDEEKDAGVYVGIFDTGIRLDDLPEDEKAGVRQLIQELYALHSGIFPMGVVSSHSFTATVGNHHVVADLINRSVEKNVGASVRVYASKSNGQIETGEGIEGIVLADQLLNSETSKSWRVVVMESEDGSPVVQARSFETGMSLLSLLRGLNQGRVLLPEPPDMEAGVGF